MPRKNAIVSESKIITSTKFTVISNLSYLNCESWINARISASDSAAAIAGRRSTASQKKLSRPQVKR